MAKEYGLNTEFLVEFDEQLNVISNINIGSIPHQSYLNILCGYI